MGVLANLNYDENITKETDSVGGNFRVFDSKIYDAVIKMAYIQTAPSGAVGINCTFAVDGSEFKETYWVTGRNGQNYYVDKNSGDKKYLGGFIQADAICCLAAKCPLSAAETETKMVRLYNKDAGADVPTKVDALIDLIDKPIKLGIVKQLVFKQKKTEKGYVDTEETKEESVTDKVFRASDFKTTAEIRAKAETAEFHKAWSTKWEGNTKDRTKKKGAAGKAGVPTTTAAVKPSSSLFDD